MKRDKITIHGPKNDGTYIVEFKTADSVALAFSVPRGRDSCSTYTPNPGSAVHRQAPRAAMARLIARRIPVTLV